MKKGELNRLLGKLSRLHARLAYTEFSKEGISKGQPCILRYLNSHEGCIQRELSEYCHLEPATVTNILSTMEREGLIEREHDPESRRSLKVFLTEKGQASLSNVEHVHQVMEKICFSGFTTEEKEEIEHYFEQICRNMLNGEESVTD